MEKIDLLLAELDGRIPASLGKKIDKLDDLNDKLENAQKEYDSEPSDENKESLEEINEFIEEFEEEITEQLEVLVDKKRNDVAKVVNTQQSTATAPIVPKEEKKESSGVLGLVIGAVLLVGSLGAINYFKNNR
jgi:phosphomannomutase